MEQSPGRVLVVVPTYNERDNLPMITAQLREAVPEAHLLITDDDSPDGTGQVADELAAADPNIHVLHRPAKEGLGAAYIAGFRWGLAEGFDVLVEMDADGSHRPEELPELLHVLADGADLVIGSRWVPGGKVVNWPWSREFLSRGANLYTRMSLGVPVRDATAGFRAYRAATLRKIGLDDVESQGYCFQVDLTLRTLRHGLRVSEVPITFVERTAGSSKMSRAVIAEALWRVTVWGVTGLPGRLRRPR
ncbi:dolichol-phosphate mannosyltransferase [Spongiactinospora gelatinilytica]|uniref:Dolichol-phosphate mannosyltransferase n=1 Tax=Spongiactinospora gelatinilytica TaxID=2666298 RepID=A0A2W2EQF7_9ACTN|nr:polyprenol monophosphomannose synthase [Spongiactinospora gelatinilytica]PZG25011.1 dolichol-phosphate mannosyltransferase [Spongiactinospora gelatinilytica]